MRAKPAKIGSVWTTREKIAKPVQKPAKINTGRADFTAAGKGFRSRGMDGTRSAFKNAR